MLEKVKRRSRQNLLRAHQRLLNRLDLPRPLRRWPRLAACQRSRVKPRYRRRRASQQPMRRAEMQPRTRILREISNTIRKERQLALSSDESPPNALKQKRRLPPPRLGGKSVPPKT